MAILAMAVPILPGKTGTWDEEIMGRIRSDKAAVDPNAPPPPLPELVYDSKA